jgi:hypothetical protein
MCQLSLVGNIAVHPVRRVGQHCMNQRNPTSGEDEKDY